MITGSRGAKAAEQKLTRTAFKTSRLLDFFSQKELTAQIGHAASEWPLVLVKELLDNAIDACEEADIAPRLRIVVDAAGVTVSDNGPGIPAEVVDGVTDFSVRVSSRDAYVSPSRGAQGNALKTLVAMPFVLGASGSGAAVRVESHGVRHTIGITVDQIRQQPVISHNKDKVKATRGTSVFVPWPDLPAAHSPRSILVDGKLRFLQIADEFAWLNPHLTLAVDWLGEHHSSRSSNTKWPKWGPSDPTSPHWYGNEEFVRLVGAYVAHDADSGRQRCVRELVSEFHGLSGTAKGKRIAEAAGLLRAHLSNLASDGQIDRQAIGTLLEAMKANSRPVKPVALGLIGSEHLAAKCEQAGAEMKSFRYRKVLGVTDGLPWIIETAFAWCPDADDRRIITGVNWSPGIINPFRQLGKYGKSLDSILEEQRAGSDEPTVLVLHVACPRVRYADRGKSSVIVEE